MTNYTKLELVAEQEVDEYSYEYSDVEHGCDDESQEWLLAARAKEEEAALEQARSLAAKLAASKRARSRICSCGYYTCPAITRFGLRPPTFHGEVEPIPSQSERDRLAVQIRRELGADA